MSANPSQPAPKREDVTADPRDHFRPAWMLRNGHVQTLAGTYLFGRWSRHHALPAHTAANGEIIVDDGDRLVYRDDCPSDWRVGDRIALLLHGLSGSHDSPYMTRIAGQLYRRNVRSVRLDWRGSGAGIALARFPYHSGRSEDLMATIVDLNNRCPGSPISLIGFSMGGNIALKFLGEAGIAGVTPAGIDRAVAVCPPIDLGFTVDSLQKGLARYYDRYFARACIRDVRRRQQFRPDAVIPDGWFSTPPRTMREFDHSFTAPVCGFASADDYYARASANQFLSKIKVPTLMIAAEDDPVIPFDQFLKAQLSPSVILRATKHGGHMGFITTRGSGWLDRQIVDWTVGIGTP